MPDPISQTEYWNSSVGDEWANQADRIDAMFQPLTQAALTALNLQPGQRVLDIGCGGGATSMAIARAVGANGSVVGVDVSLRSLDIAAERLHLDRMPPMQRERLQLLLGSTELPGKT